MKNALIWLFITSTLLTNKLLAQGQDSLSVQEQRPTGIYPSCWNRYDALGTYPNQSRFSGI